MINAIPTTYRGIKYRSRTEARWAVFLDELRLPYSYEPEGFDLDGDWYLPDFWLPTPGVWLEVKGVHPNDREMRVAGLLSRASRCPVIIAPGTPSVCNDFGLIAINGGQSNNRVAFTRYGDDLFLNSDCQNFFITLRGDRQNLGGAPDPIMATARLADAQRFGVHE